MMFNMNLTKQEFYVVAAEDEQLQEDDAQQQLQDVIVVEVAGVDNGVLPIYCQ